MDRSGQIPAFGNWDYANELPITQYFESARQAGLVRYSSSSGESDPYVRADRDLYAVDFKKPPIRNMPPSTLKKATRNRGRRCVVVKEKEKEKESVKMNMRKQGKVCDVTEQARKPVTVSKEMMRLHDAVPRSPLPRGVRLPKPVDEDLYKIPPELLRTTKRKKMLGFISKCLVPAACVS
ncbi:hypothetical protein AAZX31_19G236300 [Glycine max]|uniref:RIN4 pathogenic type III effector avirulence factor Avr cleavage site domain-containing protein n=2 Tax=Glycine subgen. Soja TaxID=1462606 RepID=I1NCG0_SOYBN|nr:uncharacterized protein LOC100777580 [Glycine max]XP_006604867.1 uncharacterized protein LOC100777580 [Glycine max]XP_006604870.1 uncharacterized protein LOC100777580 [Glycine max]XP_006604871.1 uncharacterized protein LOC100777580 [Glycine max]XP_006604872.1 uncharacterized protein LOC100777580 [Glycine max]XP_014627652.1 uncharacterized protein LOC100777580 [Glycine max]XP_014627653.1 uncharacterized protein LOC100777580 [Glycine max]XP_028216022.1 uncharacterized protein LOC114398083 [|eukprot:XP_003554738.1 uncharacterized protein LOC100777580 [Glycine max]